MVQWARLTVAVAVFVLVHSFVTMVAEGDKRMMHQAQGVLEAGSLEDTLAAAHEETLARGGERAPVARRSGKDASHDADSQGKQDSISYGILSGALAEEASSKQEKTVSKDASHDADSQGKQDSISYGILSGALVEESSSQQQQQQQQQRRLQKTKSACKGGRVEGGADCGGRAASASAVRGAATQAAEGGERHGDDGQSRGSKSFLANVYDGLSSILVELYGVTKNFLHKIAKH